MHACAKRRIRLRRWCPEKASVWGSMAGVPQLVAAISALVTCSPSLAPGLVGRVGVEAPEQDMELLMPDCSMRR